MEADKDLTESASTSPATFFSRWCNIAQQLIPDRPIISRDLPHAFSDAYWVKNGECNHLRETRMWREDDFEDKGKQINGVRKDGSREFDQ